LSNLSNTQKEFFNALNEIQDTIVNIALSKKYDNKENMLSLNEKLTSAYKEKHKMQE
jgi:hypothetical protein